MASHMVMEHLLLLTVGVTLVCIIYSGFKLDIFAFIGLEWGTPCVPCLTQNSGISLCKPKYIVCSVRLWLQIKMEVRQTYISKFREAKSLVVAMYMAYVPVDTSMVYVCSGSTTTQYSESSFRGESLGLAILYQFFRETVCDARDIAMDTEDGMKALPVRLGRKNNFCPMSILGTFVDAALTRGISTDGACVYVDRLLLAEAILRVGMSMLFYSKVLEHHHGNVISWGTASLMGFLPVIWAQRSLGG